MPILFLHQGVPTPAPWQSFSPPTLLSFFSFLWISLRNTFLFGGTLLQLNQVRFLGRLWSNKSKEVGVGASSQRLKLPLRHLIQPPPSQAWPPRDLLGSRTSLCQEEAGLLLGLSPPSCHRKGQCHSFSVNSPKSPPSPAGNFPNPGSAARPHSQGLPSLIPRLNLPEPVPPHPLSFTRSPPIPSPAYSPRSDLPKAPRTPT